MKKKRTFLSILLFFGIVNIANCNTCNVLNYGAKSNGNFLNTKNIQAAIDDCNKNGGGEVYFPPGVYLTGTIFLKSFVTLNVLQGAVILGSRNIIDYPWINSHCNYFVPPSHLDKVLVYAEHANDITGNGVIDGNYDNAIGLIQTEEWQGAPEQEIENISFSNIDISVQGEIIDKFVIPDVIPDITDIPMKGWLSFKKEWGIFPAYGFYARHVNRLNLNNVRIRLASKDIRPAIYLDDVKNLKINQLDAEVDKEADCIVRLKDVQNGSIKACSSEGFSPVYFDLLGSYSNSIVFLNNDFRNTNTGVGVENKSLKKNIKLISNITN